MWPAERSFDRDVLSYWRSGYFIPQTHSGAGKQLCFVTTELDNVQSQDVIDE